MVAPLSRTIAFSGLAELATDAHVILKQHHGTAFLLTKYDEVKAKAHDETDDN